MKYFLPFAFILLSPIAFAQTVLENNRPSVRWYQINTPNFRVLYAKDFEQEAQRIANTMEHIRSAEARSLGTEPRKISIILQNRSSISNGFVSVLPRRSEFYSMPSQNYNFLGTNDWLEMLAAHEYRHIVQYHHAKRGFNRVLYYLFGNTTFAGMAQAAAPGWFWEGDAVATETAFTPSGRGKIPNFSLVFKTNLLEGRTFNYHKQYLQSYKHEIPDEYVLGYHMISYLRKRTNDPDIWEKITRRSWNVPFIPLKFSIATKAETGMYVTQLYREMAQDLQKEWKAQIDTLTLTPYTTITRRRNSAYTDYEYPNVLEDGSVVALKRGIGDIATIVKIKNGTEKQLFVPGFLNDAGMLSVVNNRIVWNEYGYHPRWGVENYSLVKTNSEDSVHVARVIGSKRARYGSASLSKNGQVVTVQTDRSYQTNLVILNYRTGEVVMTIDNPTNAFYSMPRWSADDQAIVALKTVNEGRTISIFDVNLYKSVDVFPITQENIGAPMLVDSLLIFNSPITGIDNIFAFDLKTKQRFQITNSKYGAYNASISPDKKTIYYSDQSRNGLDIVQAPFDRTSWKEVMFVSDGYASNYRHLVEQEASPDLFTNIPAQQYPSKKFSRWKGLINPYTWGVNIDNDLSQAQVGLSSRDILSTTSIDLGYIFDIAERTSSWQARISYQGWFPIIDGRVIYANRRVNEGTWTYEESQDDWDSEELIFSWKETTFEGGLRIPLNLTQSRFSTRLEFSNNVGYTIIDDFENSITGGGRTLPFAFDGPGIEFLNYADNGNLVYNHFGIRFSRLLKQSRRDINSKWGQALFLNVLNALPAGNFTGSQFSLYGILYFPGFAKHHSIWGYAGYQSSDADYFAIEGSTTYQFRNYIPVPRGVSVSRRKQFTSFSVNYTLPLWYPDIAIGPVLNIQRFRANAFFDMASGISKTTILSNGAVNYSSTGIEIKADLNLMRFHPQFDLGFRYSVGLQPSDSRFEILIGTFNF